MNVFPPSTGLGVKVTAEIVGAFVSRVIFLVTVEDLPALSVATTVIVFEPSTNVTVVENAPVGLTVTAVPLTLTVTGDDVASFVVPETVNDLLLVINPSVGFDKVNVGGTVSILNCTETWVAALPSLSLALILTVWEPSLNAVVGVYEHSYPPVIAVFVIPSVIFEPLSIVIPIVDELTPESASVTFQVNVGLLLMIYAPAVG